jgi:hypothetical protein
VATAACAGPAVRPSPAPGPGPAAEAGLGEAAGRATLARFARALEAGRWPEAWGLLSPRWRAATSPERLAADWRGAGPVAREAAARALALAEGGAPLDAGPGEGVLRLPVGAGRAARLVAEGGRWRVDALE